MKLELDDREKKAFKEWNKQHIETAHAGDEPYTGAIGGRITFQVTGTSIGEVFTAYCGVCKAEGKPKEVYELDLSDYMTW